MIFGRIEIIDGSVSTHRDSYLLDRITTVSVRRPWLPATVLCAGGLMGYAAIFSDLLYPVEIFSIIAGAALSIGIASRLARLKFISRDLKGLEEGEAIYGDVASLNAMRRFIVKEVRSSAKEVRYE